MNTQMYARKIADYENIIRDNYLCGLMSHSLTEDAKKRLHVLKKLKNKITQRHRYKWEENEEKGLGNSKIIVSFEENKIWQW